MRILTFIAPLLGARKMTKLQGHEEEALGETSVDDDWVANEGEADEVSHALSRQQLAENLHDRRLLKKKSPHK